MISCDGWPLRRPGPSSYGRSAVLLGGMLLALAAFAGCPSGRPDQVALVDCRVLIDGQPAQDVRVTLRPLEALDSPFELVGVTDQNGIAAMTLAESSLVPSAAEVKLRATVESLGDWAIREPWCDPRRSPLELTWSGNELPLEIELPRKAVGRL